MEASRQTRKLIHDAVVEIEEIDRSDLPYVLEALCKDAKKLREFALVNKSLVDTEMLLVSMLDDVLTVIQFVSESIEESRVS